MAEIEWRTSCAPIDYAEALAWMDARVQAIQREEAPECIWLLEHPPLYTLGTSGKEGDILPTVPHPIFATGRGGQVTYHGPGQRVVYVMVDLKRRSNQDIHQYIAMLEEWIIEVLDHFGVKGERREGRVGIWVNRDGGESKIAAIGVRVQKWVTSHGFSLNISPDLSAYDHITPCGLPQYGVTSLADLGVKCEVEEVDAVLRSVISIR